MLTLDEYRVLVDEIRAVPLGERKRILELLLKYTDLSSEDNELADIFDEKFVSKIEVE